jgi:hypothetical protein
MKTFTPLFVLCFIAFPFLNACNNLSEKKVEGNWMVTNHLIDMQDFDEIRMDCPGEIIYKQFSEEQPFFQITTDENIFAYLTLRVENRCLIISRNDTVIAPSKFTVYTNSRNLEKITLCDAAKIHLANQVNAKRMEIDVAGKAQVTMDSLICQEIKVSVAGEGKVELTGGSNKAYFYTEDNGSLVTENFLSETYEELTSHNL